MVDMLSVVKKEFPELYTKRGAVKKQKPKQFKCNSLQGLYDGKPIKYLESIQVLLEALEKNKVSEQKNQE